MAEMEWQSSCASRKLMSAVVSGSLLLCSQHAAAEPMRLAALADMSFEELADIEVTSVSKHAEKLSDAAASIFVITGNDIRRSGANSIPEALRLAPNLDVARVNANAYAISARGFNNAIGNKLLVLIDGRSVYTPTFSGVNWEMQNVMLEDVERIEVISGPGATLWGANAVNGVINIITKKASETQGGLISAVTGNRSSEGAIRYGGKFGESGYYRVYGMGFGRDDTERNGVPQQDGWRNRQGGFRVDWESAGDAFTVKGDSYDIDLDRNSYGTPTRAGSNLLARWKRQLDGDASIEVQAYYDHTEHDDPTLYSDREDTYDIQFQHSFTWSDQHHIVWGGGSRYDRSDTQAHAGATILLFELVPPQRNLRWNNIFFQDEIALQRDLSLTLGLKAESNVYTGTDYLPTVRLAWNVDERNLLWSAFSRAVRAPARYDRDLNLYVGSTQFIAGGPNFQSEIANVFEIGYRTQPNSRFSYSATAFYSDYDKLRSGQSFPPAAQVQNMMNSTTMGVESWATWQVTPSWRLSGGFRSMKEHFSLDPGSTDPDGATDAANDAELTWNLRSSLNLTDRHELDVMVRRVSALPFPEIPAYTAVDVNMNWRVTPKLDVSLSVRNLFDPTHVEFSSSTSSLVVNEIDRSVDLRARLAF